MTKKEIKIIPIGTKIKPYGVIKMVGWVGERYYWLIDKDNTISMMPASLIESIYYKND